MFGSPAFFLFSIFGSMLPFALILALAVLWRRSNDSDPAGRRPFAVYLFSMIFVLTMTILASIGLIAGAIGHAATDTAFAFGGGETSCSVSGLSSFSGAAAPPPVDLSPRRAVPSAAATTFPGVGQAPPPQFVPIPRRSPITPNPIENCVTNDRFGPGSGPLVSRAAIVAAVAMFFLMFHIFHARELLLKEATR